jgi:hypothetical protein
MYNPTFKVDERRLEGRKERKGYWKPETMPEDSW